MPKASHDVWPSVWCWSNICVEVHFLSFVPSGWPYALASDGSLVGYTSDDVGCFPTPVSAAVVNIAVADIFRIAAAVAVSTMLKCVCTPCVCSRSLQNLQTQDSYSGACIVQGVYGLLLREAHLGCCWVSGTETFCALPTEVAEEQVPKTI